MVSYHPQLHLHDITDNTFISVVKLKIGMKSIIKYCTIKETIYLLRGKQFRQLERVTLLAACFTAEFSFCFLDEYSRVFTIRYQEKKREKDSLFSLQFASLHVLQTNACPDVWRRDLNYSWCVGTVNGKRNLNWMLSDMQVWTRK